MRRINGGVLARLRSKNQGIGSFGIIDLILAPPLSNPGLGDCPEGCVALVLNHLDPLEICKLARLNRAFHNASSADFVWELKLPSDYQFLIDKLFGGFLEILVKKEIYARLCRPNSFYGGTKCARSTENLRSLVFTSAKFPLKLIGPSTELSCFSLGNISELSLTAVMVHNKGLDID
ncbi:hypothetical protein L1049_021228 [Liquidambar formosana]|uniref:F-box domain-containing protein n=1 Tax=Liquidambar formosana TaxID=63359 RepID=A0AAP0SDT1_LIQFO